MYTCCNCRQLFFTLCVFISFHFSYRSMLSCCYVYMTIIIVIIITAMLSLRGRFNSCGLFECVTVCLIHTTISSRLLLSLRIYVNKCYLHSVPQCRMLNLGADESELERDFLTPGHCYCCCCCFFLYGVYMYM